MDLSSLFFLLFQRRSLPTRTLSPTDNITLPFLGDFDTQLFLQQLAQLSPIAQVYPPSAGSVVARVDRRIFFLVLARARYDPVKPLWAGHRAGEPDLFVRGLLVEYVRARFRVGDC